MTTFQIIGLIAMALIGLYVFYCIYNLEKFNKKKGHRQKKVLTVLLTLAALFAGQSAWAQIQDVTLTVDPEIPEGTAGHWYVNMHRSNNQQLTLYETDITTGGKNVFKVYDDGGKNGDYSANCNGNLDITVPEGYAFLVTGTLWTEHNPTSVYLRFAESLYNYIGDRWYSDTDGELKTVGPVTCDGNVMRIRFCSENAQYAGFDLTVTVVDKNTDFAVNVSNPTHGSLAVNSTAKLGETVTVTPTPDTDFTTTEVSYTACSTKFVITPVNGIYSFTMPACDVSVDAVFMDDVMVLWGVDANGTEEHPYVISSQEGWDLLVTKSATNGFTHNLHFRLDTDLTNVTQSLSRFGGHLDGNGHTITLNMTLDNNGLINSGINCTISNLTVEGSINNNIANVGGFVASSPIYNNIITLTDCHSSVTITSTYSGNDHHCGGLVGNANNVTCERCVFDGAFVGSCYGFSGLVGHCSQLTLTDCIVVFGSTTSLTSQLGVCFSFADYNSITGNGQNFYYNKGSISGGIISQGGTQTYSLTLSEPASVVRSNGTAIGNGAGTAYTDGFTYGNEEYYTSGATVTLSAPAGIRIASATYNGNAATLNSDGTASFIMPTANTTATITGFAANYIDADGTLQTHAVNLLSSSDEAVTKAGGWYAVTGDVTINKGLTFSGAAHLILTDGATLSSNDNYYMTITDSNTDVTQIAISATDLNIYGQTLGTGTLNISSTNAILANNRYAYGINATGNLTICGGYVNATANRFESYPVMNGTVTCHAIHADNNVTIIRGHVSARANENTSIHSFSNLFTISASNVLLDWRLPTDRICLTTNLQGKPSTVSVAEGKSLWNGTEVLSGDISRDQFNDKTLQPCIAREIEGYDTGNDKWAFIASPVATEGGIAPNTVGNLIGSQIQTEPTVLYNFDLYRLHPSNMMWQNYHAHTADFNIVNGQGYLYATRETKTLAFMGDAFNIGTAPDTVPLVYDNNAEFAGWNLVGNPFTVDAYVNRPFYKMNTAGTGIVAVENYDNYTIAQTIPACTGIVVKADNSGESVTFSTSAPTLAAPNNGNLQITLTQANTRGNALLDNAIVSFNEGAQLGKFYFGEQNGNIYIPQGGEEYAIVSVGGRDAMHCVSTEIPVNFKAKENGEYTITVNPEGVTFGYLHLIDNLTGTDVDLFQTPTYTFTAKTTDYESRFKLVFSVCGAANDDNEAPFAFINNGNIIVNGTGTLQVIDVMGRVIVCRDAMHCVSTTGMTPGVYVLRLINGNDVRTQKIVIP